MIYRIILTKALGEESVMQLVQAVAEKIISDKEVGKFDGKATNCKISFAYDVSDELRKLIMCKQWTELEEGIHFQLCPSPITSSGDLGEEGKDWKWEARPIDSNFKESYRALTIGKKNNSKHRTADYREGLEVGIEIGAYHEKERREKLLTDIIEEHTQKLNTMKANRAKWEEEKWTDAEIQECDRMITMLAGILSGLNKIRL